LQAGGVEREQQQTDGDPGRGRRSSEGAAPAAGLQQPTGRRCPPPNRAPPQPQNPPPGAQQNLPNPRHVIVAAKVASPSFHSVNRSFSDVSTLGRKSTSSFSQETS